jgi:trigger factor
MEAQVEQLGGDRVRLMVEVPAADVHHAIEHATTDLAARVKIPGFRAGKVPAPVLISRVGRDRVYSEAVESHIGGWFWDAAARSRVQPVDSPDTSMSCPRATPRTEFHRRVRRKRSRTGRLDGARGAEARGRGPEEVS